LYKQAFSYVRTGTAAARQIINYNTALMYCTVLYYTILYYTALYCTCSFMFHLAELTPFGFSYF